MQQSNTNNIKIKCNKAILQAVNRTALSCRKNIKPQNMQQSNTNKNKMQ